LPLPLQLPLPLPLLRKHQNLGAPSIPRLCGMGGKNKGQPVVSLALAFLSVIPSGNLLLRRTLQSPDKATRYTQVRGLEA